MKIQKVYIQGAPQGAPFLKIMVADTFFLRLRGLMFHKILPPATGLLLEPCNSVHMCFMRFAIDVVYLDKEFNIIKIVKNLRPWVDLSMCSQAWAALEMTEGEVERWSLAVGQKLIKEEF